MGDPISGTREYRVRYFDNETGGNQLGTDLTGSTVLSEGGVFNFEVLLPASVLGVANPWYELALDTSDPADGIDANDVFVDRFKVNSVPFALLSEDSNNLGGTAASDFVTDAELSAGLSGKSNVGHTHGAADIVSGTLSDARVTDALTVDGGTIDGSPIGVTNPDEGYFTNLTGASLLIADGTATGNWVVDGDLTLGGQVGIGTTTPETALEVIGKVSATEICAASATFDTASFISDVTFGGNLVLAGKVVVGASSTPFHPFATDLGVTSNSPGDLANDDFVFGSGQLDDTGSGADDARFFFDKNKGAFRAGSVDGAEWDDANRGPFSAALGTNTIASGPGSTAMGYQNTASGDYSTAAGYSNIASGRGSTAMGVTNAATAESSTALGVSTVASGFGSVAIGTDTTASGISSTAMGVSTFASGWFSTAMGFGTKASGQTSLAIGQGIEAAGERSVAIALNDQNGTVIGQDNTLAILGGTVGLGHATPSVALEVVGDVSASGIVKGATGIFGTSTVTIHDDVLVSAGGRIGIGTDTPTQALTIDSGSVLQTPGDPVLVGTLGIGANSFGLDVSGRYAYVVDANSDDLKIIDVSDPTTPEIIGSVGFTGAPIKVFVSGRYAYVIDFVAEIIAIVDVSDPTAPSITGQLTLGDNPDPLYVSGRYAYVMDTVDDDLRVIDISDPSAPAQVGIVDVGNVPTAIQVSGQYAFFVDRETDQLTAVDISNPNAPTEVGSLGIGTFPVDLYVSGRYAYVVDTETDDLKVIDISDPTTPTLTGTLGIGSHPVSVEVSGRYAYIADFGSHDLKVIDVSDPTTPRLLTSVALGPSPQEMVVSGRYAYVIDTNADDLRVIDLSGGEMSSLLAHSLEAGNLQVRNDIIGQGEITTIGGLSVGGTAQIGGGLGVAGDVGGFVMSVVNDGNNAGRGGIVVQAGADGGTGLTDYLLGLDGNGDIVGALRNNGGTFSAVDLSDRKSKTNIEDTKVDALDVIERLRVVDFNRKANPDGPKIHGFIAQEAQEVFPEMVTPLNEEMLGISKETLIPILTKAIQEQQAQIAELREQVRALSQGRETERD
jgi:hypothetical protein